MINTMEKPPVDIAGKMDVSTGSLYTKKLADKKTSA
jgi:hypothetical protein